MLEMKRVLSSNDPSNDVKQPKLEILTEKKSTVVAMPTEFVRGLGRRYVRHFGARVAGLSEETIRTSCPFPDMENVIKYFEITVEELNQEGAIAIGMGTECIQERGFLPGWAFGSWGYHSDDGKAFSGETRGLGKRFGPTFGRGDTIGCGVNNCGEMFFSLNGKYLGIAFNSGIPRVGLYPVVGIDVWGTVSANFGQSPFMLDVGKYAILSASQRPDIFVSNSKVKLESLSNDVLSLILEYSSSASEAISIARLNKRFSGLIFEHNSLWEQLSRKKWVFIRNSQKITSWYRFYKRRKLALDTEFMNEKLHPIENCIEWEFKCPIALELLKRTANPKIDFCTSCKKNVYISKTMEELESHIKVGHCVVYDENSEIEKERNPIRHMMGAMVMR